MVDSIKVLEMGREDKWGPEFGVVERALHWGRVGDQAASSFVTTLLCDLGAVTFKYSNNWGYKLLLTG